MPGLLSAAPVSMARVLPVMQKYQQLGQTQAESDGDSGHDDWRKVNQSQAIHGPSSTDKKFRMRSEPENNITPAISQSPGLDGHSPFKRGMTTEPTRQVDAMPVNRLAIWLSHAFRRSARYL